MRGIFLVCYGIITIIISYYDLLGDVRNKTKIKSKNISLPMFLVKQTSCAFLSKAYYGIHSPMYTVISDADVQGYKRIGLLYRKRLRISWSLTSFPATTCRLPASKYLTSPGAQHRVTYSNFNPIYCM